MVAYAILILSLLSAPLFGGDLIINSFSGLNTEDNAATIDSSQAQDLLNVDIIGRGSGISKRKGYSLYKQLPVYTSTTAVHGGHHFQDSSGSDIQLWGNDVSLSAIVDGATPVEVATGTVSSTWQCTDSQGNAYCFNSSRDAPVKTDGTTGGTSYTSIPKGTMGAFTPDRLVVSGVSGSANTLHFSEQNVFTNFTTGVAATSPWTEVIASPGSRITHVRYACDKLMWFKDQSFGYLIGTNQFDIQVGIVQSDIGTLDNSSAYYNGHLYFRGQDNHIYDYDCSNVVRLSTLIKPNISQASKRKANSWTQDSQSDFEGGSSSNTYPISTTIEPGAVTVSSWAVTFSTGYLYNGGMEYNYSCAGSGTCVSSWTSTSGLPLASLTSATRTVGCGGATLTPRTGSRMGCIRTDSGVADVSLHLVDPNDNDIRYSTSTVWQALDPETCSWTSASAIFGSQYVGFPAKYQISWAVGGVRYTETNNAIIRPGTTVIGNYFATANATFDYVCFDDMVGDYVTSASTPSIDQSKYFNFQYTSFTLSGYTPTFKVQASSSVNGAWYNKSTSSDTVIFSTANYVRLYSNWADQDDDQAYPTLVGRSTGTYFSAVHNAPSLTSWDTFSADETLNGGTLTYYTRSSTNTFTVLSSTPAWTAQTLDAQVAASTGTFMQTKVDFGITTATQTPTLDAFTFSWYEGNATDKAYIEYFDDHLWVALSSGTTGINNRIFRWDIPNAAWLIDDIGSNGLVVDQNRLFIGDPNQGYVYQFGNSDSDAGTDINAYWKSKDFVGEDPFVQNELKAQDWLVDGSTGTMTISYTTDASSTTTYSLNLYSSTVGVLRRSYNLPSGKIGTFFNVQFEDDSSYPAWEVFGHRTRYRSLPWRSE